MRAPGGSFIVHSVQTRATFEDEICFSSITSDAPQEICVQRVAVYGFQCGATWFAWSIPIRGYSIWQGFPCGILLFF
jgi:hypothetical protein